MSAPLKTEQLDKLKDLNYALFLCQQGQRDTLEEESKGEYNIVTAQDNIRGLYGIVVEMAQAAGIAFNTDMDDEGRCPPCNTIPIEDACLNCPTLEAKR